MAKTIIGCIVSAIIGAGAALAITTYQPADRDRSAGDAEQNEEIAAAPLRGTRASDSAAATAAPANGEGGEIQLNISRRPPLAEDAGDEIPAFAGDGLTAEERVSVGVYENVNRSVVNINTKTVRDDNFLFFDGPAQSSGAGSGSVLDKQGHILTNYHVVEGAREVIVTLYDGQNYRAELVGQDAYTDMAVLRVDAPSETLFPVTLGDSLALKVGQRVFAIGNPFGLERTLTVGIVSSLNRTIPTRDARKIRSVIQTDAAINPGSSGGPLLNSRGEVVGMNTAIASSTGQNSGIGFAIPVSAIKRIVPRLVRDGRVIRADSGIARVLETEQGLVVALLTPDGPAERAGLQPFRIVTERRRQGPFVYESRRVDQSSADRIVAVDGQPVTRADQLIDLIESKQPGDTATFTVIRDGRRTEVPVRLEATP